MKPLIIVLVLLVGVLAYTLLKPSADQSAATSTAPTLNKPIWEQPIPEGTELVPAGEAAINVRVGRRNENNKALIDFDLSEEHGYAVDGIRLTYRYVGAGNADKPAATSKAIGYLVPQRLDFDSTLKTSTVLMDVEFKDLDVDLAKTTAADWEATVVTYERAIRRK
ncbi:MAG TPA: hypothetical protein P5572_11235 [Phycisphaerae bacterium]|nr:hypothetical protein [Phycisphaerae bacterium]